MKSKYTIRLLRIAEEDLNEIVNYIAVDNLSAAENVLNKIENKLNHLSEFPYLGQIPKEAELKLHGYRFIIVENYLIFYTVEDNTIIVHRIIHGARDYQKLL